MHLLTLVSMLALQAAASPVRQPADIRARLDAYEKRTQQTNRPDPAALAEIGRLVIEQSRRSPKFQVWTEACASTVVAESHDCASRLRAILNRSTEPIERRAEAAAALIARGDTEAGAALHSALKTARTATLAPLAPIVALLPAADAVPLLTRLTASPSTAEQSVGCRYLGGFDTAEVRAAVTKVVDTNPPGTEPWLVCMIARARLRDVDARTVAGYGHTLQGEGLLYAAGVMLEVGDQESAEQILTDLTHRGSTGSRLAAATQLIGHKNEVAIPIIEAALRDPDRDIRAQAVAAERKLKRPPSVLVRGMLADGFEIVRIRAAEIALEWEHRELFR